MSKKQKENALDREESMRTFIHELARFMASTMCQVCYLPMEIMDANGTWCKRCHKEFTDGLINPAKRISILDLVKKYRKEYDEYKERTDTADPARNKRAIA